MAAHLLCEDDRGDVEAHGEAEVNAHLEPILHAARELVVAVGAVALDEAGDRRGEDGDEAGLEGVGGRCDHRDGEDDREHVPSDGHLEDGEEAREEDHVVGRVERDGVLRVRDPADDADEDHDDDRDGDGDPRADAHVAVRLGRPDALPHAGVHQVGRGHGDHEDDHHREAVAHLPGRGGRA